ncbi:hypothetical protein MXT04_24430 [Escherichia coli]|uniref:hypothetical protein n=1 Tax=Escherichia coli TaxID=562 RepID=UPI0028E0EB64|nr:hypothetical protein [Escherichia coli]MDT9429885.1 hypothetical protein [Escherichia coli]MDT9471781.1 hypothetical protein [Escherichia coli]
MKVKAFIESHKGRLMIGAMFLLFCAMCSVMTIAFTYSNSKIRAEYRDIADERDKKVESLAVQVGEMKAKLDSIPERTAEKTADKVKPLVEEEKK